MSLSAASALLGSLAIVAAASASTPEFGVRPALSGATTLDGGHFAYALPAGGRVSDAIVVSNLSGAPLVFRVHGADLETVAGGGVAPTSEGVAPRLVGTWISVSRPEFTLPAHGEIIDPFSVTIPASAAPGDYLGAVVVAKQPAAASRSLLVQTRAALIVKVTIPGQLHLSATLGTLSGEQRDGDERFTLTVRNSGNVLYTFFGEVTVRNRSSTVAVLPVDPRGIYVIPGGSAAVHATWHGAPAFGDVTAVATIHVDVNSVPSGTFTSTTLRLSFFAWLPLLAISIALVLALLLLRLATARVRRRHRKVR